MIGLTITTLVAGVDKTTDEELEALLAGLLVVANEVVDDPAFELVEEL